MRADLPSVEDSLLAYSGSLSSLPSGETGRIRADDQRSLGQLRPIVVIASCKRGAVCPERHTQTAES